MINVFLSASVPLPDRDPKYLATADVVAIRDSIKALVTAVVPKGHLTFGGHPAITPLIAQLLRGLGDSSRQRVTLYQSEYFTREFPIENDEFIRYVITPSVRNSREESLSEMRTRMLNDAAFGAGVFIGGMEGVEDEFNAFRKAHPRIPVWPIASTGAAAFNIFERLDRPEPDLFLREMTYETLFRRLLNKSR